MGGSSPFEAPGNVFTYSRTLRHLSHHFANRQAIDDPAAIPGSENDGSMSMQRVSGLLIVAALATSGCGRRYTEIEVRDPGRVGVGVWNEQGSSMALLPDGAQRVVRLPVPGVVAMRRGREVAIAWNDELPVTLIDERGVLPRTPPGPGIEIREQRLWAFYNVTPKRVYPQKVQPGDSVPIVLTTEMTNVIDAREVREVRHWPAYVCLPPGVLFTVLGTALLASDKTGAKVGGGVFLAGAIPLVIFSVLNLTSSNEVKPLAIPGGPAP